MQKFPFELDQLTSIWVKALLWCQEREEGQAAAAVAGDIGDLTKQVICCFSDRPTADLWLSLKHWQNFSNFSPRFLKYASPQVDKDNVNSGEILIS